MKALDPEIWHRWIPTLERAAFEELDAAEQTAALTVFGDADTYGGYRQAVLWGQKVAEIPAPGTSIRVKAVLDAAWEEEMAEPSSTKAPVLLPLLRWMGSVAAGLLVFGAGWYLGHRNPRVEYVATEPTVQIVKEFITDTVYQTETVVRRLPADTVFVDREVPVYITITKVPESNTQERSYESVTLSGNDILQEMLRGEK